MTGVFNKLAVAVLFGLLVAGYPIASGFSVLSGAPSQSFAIFFRALVVLLSCQIIFMAITNRDESEESSVTLMYWGCLFLMWGSYAVRFFTDVYDGTRYSEELVMVGTFVGTTLIPFFAIQTREAIPRSHLVFRVVFYCVLMGALLNIHLIFSSNIITQMAALSGRARSASLNPISLSMLGAQLSILCLYVLVTRKSRVIIGNQVVLPSLCVGIVVLLIGGSRGPILAFLCSLIPLFFLSAGVLHGAAKIKVVALSAAMIGALIYVAILLQNVYQVSTVQRVEALVSGGLAEDHTSYLRLQHMQGAVDQFFSSPLFGDSIVVTSTGAYPHNIPLELLMATGVIGFLSYLVLLVWSLRASVHILLHLQPYAWIVLLYAQVLTISMVSGNVWSSSLMWCLMGATICVSKHTQIRVRSSARVSL